jgi:hypothetical protein
MVCGTFTESKVPKNNLLHRVAMWNSNGATSVTWTPDEDSTFTITAVFPPCPDNVSHNAESESPGD